MSDKTDELAEMARLEVGRATGSGPTVASLQARLRDAEHAVRRRDEELDAIHRALRDMTHASAPDECSALDLVRLVRERLAKPLEPMSLSKRVCLCRSCSPDGMCPTHAAEARAAADNKRPDVLRILRDNLEHYQRACDDPLCRSSYSIGARDVLAQLIAEMEPEAAPCASPPLDEGCVCSDDEPECNWCLEHPVKEGLFAEMGRAVDALVATDKASDTGPCMAVLHGIPGQSWVCALRHGHTGGHETKKGWPSWTDPAPCTSEAQSRCKECGK